jgi:hypothetical protein
MYEDLDHILQRRAVPEVPHGLAEQIIAAAARMEKAGPRRRRMVTDLWQGFAEMFVLPQPAFALAIVLVIGLTLGLNGQVQSLLADEGDDLMTSFALADDNYEDGALL